MTQLHFAVGLECIHIHTNNHPAPYMHSVHTYTHTRTQCTIQQKVKRQRSIFIIAFYNLHFLFKDHNTATHKHRIVMTDTKDGHQCEAEECLLHQTKGFEKAKNKTASFIPAKHNASGSACNNRHTQTQKHACRYLCWNAYRDIHMQKH